ncbi:putative quinol monooxygenase [Pantoea septica]|uniref:putative quinol monooxygenase n=1 Tax=Pantoea septica TaxID=472695 RepID=UPI0028A12AFB|nr:antibiotic biosynthesis monooxygenase [Pantoea septica]
MTVPVVASFIAKLGKESQVQSLFRGVIETTLKEDGCVSYQLNCDTENLRRFVWTEEWHSKAQIERHIRAAHIINVV